MHALRGDGLEAGRRKVVALILVALVLGHHVVEASNKAAAGQRAEGEPLNGSAPSVWSVEGLSRDAAAFAAFSPEVALLAERGVSAPHRLLAAVSAVLPADKTAITLQLEIVAPVPCPPLSCTEITGLYAGLRIMAPDNPDKGGLSINLEDGITFERPATIFAELRVVQGDTTNAQANAGACLETHPDGVYDATVNEPWSAEGSQTTVSLTNTGTPSGDMLASSMLVFAQGGSFKICYSDDGSFSAGHASLLPPILTVYGLYDNRQVCSRDPTCLQTRRYHCFLLRLAHNNHKDSRSAPNSCVVDFETDGKGIAGPIGKGSWSSKFTATYDDDGQLKTPVVEIKCGDSVPEPILCKDGPECDTGNDFFPVDADVTTKKGTMRMPAGRNDLVGISVYAPRTVAACYCPDYDGCDAPTDFIQQVGILHYYITKICEVGAAGTTCQNDYNGASPQHRFSVRLECPTDACQGNTENRLKIIAQTDSNDLPMWARNQDGSMASGCGVVGFEAHGVNEGGLLVLPPDMPNFDVESVSGNFPGAVIASRAVKTWNYRDTNYDASEAGFLFRMGFTYYELRSSNSSETFDLCYCDSDCSAKTNWFKVGQLRFASFRLVSGATNVSATADQLTIAYVNEPGTLAFSVPELDYGVYGLQPGGMLNLFEDNDMSMTDEGCKAEGYDRYLIEREDGGLRKTTAHTLFTGQRPAEDPKRLVFNGGSTNNVITIKKAGVLAICYCSNVVGDVCAYDHWVLATRITIRGPSLGQTWTFSTHVTFRFAYYGYGLSSEDTVRIISRDSECTDPNDLGNPNGEFPLTGIKVQCPHPCTAVGKPAVEPNGDLSVIVESDSTYQCNHLNAACRSNEVSYVTVVDENTTEVKFENAPYLTDGDMITLLDNVECDPSDLAPEGKCNEDKLAVVKGLFRYHDSENDVLAPDHFIAGHKITNTDDSKVVTINVGWPVSERPTFKVFQRSGKLGGWVKHNKAITREEILSTTAREDMKVCWKYGGPLGRYVTEAGRLTFVDPNTMSFSLVSLVTDQLKQKAPLIITFQTAAGVFGQRYRDVAGPTQLKIVFTRVIALDPHFVDGSTIATNLGQDDLGEAKQYVCGKLFKELWSSDGDLGFPFPRGCYFKVYGETKELNLVFDRKNGLAPGQDYMLVVNGRALDEAVGGGEYVQIFTMDDVELRPYEAIERGIAKLDRTPLQAAYGYEGVKFLQPDGLKIETNEGLNNYELRGGKDLGLKLYGDPEAGGIKERSVLRVFLWPLLMWNVDRICTAVCIAHDQDSPCGPIEECKGDSIVPNYHMNFLQIRLPTGMATMTKYVTHMVSISGLRLPQGGFFATRISGQISMPDGTKPHYTVSVGDFLWKSPDDGQSVGKLVHFYGDGNQKPFRGDRLNVLYASITLAATLFSVVSKGDAQLTLNLPEGYRCIRPLDIDGRSPWQAEEDLNIFAGGIAPYGRGSLDEGSGVRGWSVEGNRCMYKLRQNGVVYAGSALYVRITVDNPDFTLKREDNANAWSVTLSSKGHNQWPVTFDPVNFKSAAGNFSENEAVLGRITEAVLVPENFAISGDQFNRQRGKLHIIFRTEQDTGVSASIQLLAPEAFTFDNPCVVGNLDTVYYSTRPGFGTKRLPCMECECSSVTTPEIRMLINLDGGLEAMTYYAFFAEATNPFEFSEDMQHGWRIFTLSKNDYRVDGTPDTITLFNLHAPSLAPETNLTGRSFGLCQTQLNEPNEDPRFGVEIFNMLPYSMTGQTAAVNVFPLKVPSIVSGPIRLMVVAPEGFKWDFTDFEFKYRKYAPGIDNVFNPVSADMPGETDAIPERDGNVLFWRLGFVWDPAETYGFQARIRVPDSTPTSSTNTFYAKFSYLDENSTCLAASVVHNKVVGALMNPMVDFITNVESKANSLIFTLETVTTIPRNGYLKIIGPPKFVIDSTCTLLSAPAERGSAYVVRTTAPLVKELPSGLFCVADTSSSSKVEILITAAASPIVPGRYRWMMAVTNPNMVVPNPEDETTPCGYDLCWSFSTHFESGVEIDLPVTYPAFPVNLNFLEAFIPPLTDQERAATGRNDRPTHDNPLVFAFRRKAQVLDPAWLTLRAPEGFVFREDCISDVDTRGAEVFGSDVPLPPAFTEWNQDVIVRSCRGEGPDAKLWIDPDYSLGLQPEVLYPFRIRVLSNPSKQPSPNKFFMSFAGESSDPFDGFTLWRFTRISIHTASTALSTPETGAILIWNPVLFTIRPFNTVKGIGMQIKITAPPGFIIANMNGECTLMIQPVSSDFVSVANADPDTSPEPNYLGPPSLLWGRADAPCHVDMRTNPAFMVATVKADIRELTANRDYQLVVFVHNPSVNLSPEENVWKIETADSPQQSGVLPTFRDEVSIPGFPLNERARTWYYRNEGPPPVSEVYDRGMAAVPDLYFEFMFLDKLLYGDIIEIHAPRGFNFPADCATFRWEPPQDAYLYLPNSPRTCDGEVMRFTVQEPGRIAQLTMFAFRIDMMNPSKTPHPMENNWRIFLTSAGVLLASEMAVGWTIKPQLKQTQVLLVGQHQAAGSRSAISISFMPVSDADELMLEARLPQGFDFTGAVATSVGHKVTSTNVEQIRVSVAIYADVQADVRIEEFTLGLFGGQTEFDLVTRLSNGEKMDESLRFTGGFRLPGRVDVQGQTLMSVYEMNPKEFPVASLWMPRMGENAVVKFHFKLQVRGELGQMLRLRASGYSLMMTDFKISKMEPYVRVVSSEIISIAGPELVARFGELIWTGFLYEISMNVVTPQVPNPEDQVVSIEVLDGGELPVNTNDQTTEGFRLVDVAGLRISASRAPPVAEVTAVLDINPRNLKPTEAVIVAPLGFNFTANCLVEPGDNNEVQSCTLRSEMAAGRATAKLVFQDTGLVAPPEYVVIRIVTPADNTDDKSWFIELRDRFADQQLAWGEDPVGVEVRQMIGASVVYSGVPRVDGWMTFGFSTNVKIEAGGKLRVGYPQSMTIRCGGDFLAKVNLEGNVNCEVFPRQSFFEVRMERPLPPGKQAFAVTSTAPPAYREENNFYIMVYEADNKVADAAMRIPGLKIQHGLELSALPLSWSNSEPLKQGRVGLGFELLSDLPEIDPPLMAEMVITVPQDFVQQVRAARQIEVVDVPLPKAENMEWIDSTDPRRLRMFFDTEKTKQLAPARYAFSFPIFVPARLPSYNVYTMTICKPDVANTSCTHPSDERALVTFTWPGFNFGDIHPSANQYSLTGRARRNLVGGAAMVAAACLFATAPWRLVIQDDRR